MIITRARAAALVFGGALAGTLRSPGAAQANAPIRVAAIPIAGASEPSIAKDAGIFAKAGLDVDVQLMQGSSAIAAAVLSNAVDIGYSAVDTLATAYLKGVSLVALAPASEYVSALDARDAALVVPPNSLVRQAKDLNGKVIAVNSLSGIAFLSTRGWIDQNGGDSSTVKFVEVPFSAMPVAIEEGRIDAAQVTEPFIDAAKKSGRILTYGLNDAVSKHFIISVWFTTPQWAAAHADAAQRFAAALRETAIWTNQKSNQPQRDAIVAKFTKLDPAVIAATLAPHFGEQLTPALMQPPIDINAKYNKYAAVGAQQLIYAPR